MTVKTCSDCGSPVWKGNATGYCSSCYQNHRPLQKKSFEVTGILSSNYSHRHAQVIRARGKASKHYCFFCIAKKARDWATIHGTDGSLLVHYGPSCASCHRRYDNTEEGRARTAKANQGNTYGKANKGKKKPPGFADKMRERQKKLWADPEWRAKTIAAGKTARAARSKR